MAKLKSIQYKKKARVLALGFEKNSFELPAEYLRVYSPSAEVRGHGLAEPKLVAGKRNIAIAKIEPVGHYAVRLVFDDGHDTGLYTFDLMYDLGENHEKYWQHYLARMQDAGISRDDDVMPLNVVIQQSTKKQ